jgi:hypothetical protein
MPARRFAARHPRLRSDYASGGRTPGVVAQKKLIHASERDTERVAAARLLYQALIATPDFRCCKFIDESGVNISMTRLYGRAPKGERVLGSAPQN